MRISIKSRLFLSHFLAVALVSGSIGTFFYFSAMNSLLDNLKTRLANTAAMAAQSVDIKSLDSVRSPADASLPVYQSTLAMLRRLRGTNPDIAYIYIMRRSGSQTFFVLDSDQTKRQALPGSEYPNPPEPLLAGFDTASVDDQLYTDEWGVFMSGYAPLRGGQYPALLGIDMRDAEVSHTLRQLRISGMISLILSLILASLFATSLSRRFNRALQLFMKTCADVAEGKPDVQIKVNTGDELDKLASALNAMSSKLADNQARRTEAEADLKRSRDEMESKVLERTTELQALNERLVFEIEERKKAEQALFQAAMTDSLTGLPNRRAMEGHLSVHVARVKRSGKPFSVLMCDVDRFKSVNDTYGHEVGDQLLRLAAQVLRSSIREGDLIGRWGGEEFLVLLEETDLDGGLKVAEKLRESFADLKLRANESTVSRTISIGVMVCVDCLDEDEVVRKADEALYEAKRLGRNRIVTAEPLKANETSPG